MISVEGGGFTRSSITESDPFMRRDDVARLSTRRSKTVSQLGETSERKRKKRHERTDDTGKLINLALGTTEGTELFENNEN